jgi:hypothetical protein
MPSDLKNASAMSPRPGGNSGCMSFRASPAGGCEESSGSIGANNRVAEKTLYKSIEIGYDVAATMAIVL